MSAFSRIEVEVGLDGRGFRSGLNQMSGQMSQWTGNIKGQLAGLFGIGFLTRMVRDTAKWASKMQDLALQLELSTDELQLFELAGKKTGTTIEQLTTAIGVLGKNRNDILGNISQKGDAFDKIFGIKGTEQAKKTARDAFIKDKSLGELFLAIGEQFNQKEFGGAASGLLTEMIGKNGPRFLVAFKEGFGKIFDELKDSGAVTGKATISKLDELVDKWSVLIAQIRGPFANGMVWVVEQLEKGFHKVEESVLLIANLIQVINENGGIKIIQESAQESIADFLVKRNLALKRKQIEMDGGISEAERNTQLHEIEWQEEALAQGDEGGKLKLKDLIEEVNNRTAEDLAELYDKRTLEQIAREGINRRIPGGDVDEPARKSGTTKSIPSDSLSKIGGFVGASNRVLTVQERIARASEAQVDLLKKGIRIHDL